MKALALVPLALLCAGLAQAGTVQVSFDHPERYVDAGTLREAEAVRQVIDRHLQALGHKKLQALGRKKLPAGQTLTVTDSMRSTNLRFNAQLPYERRMLSAWFDRRFGTNPVR